MVPTGEEYFGITYTGLKMGGFYHTRNFARNIGPEGQAALIYEGHRCHSLGFV